MCFQFHALFIFRSTAEIVQLQFRLYKKNASAFACLYYFSVLHPIYRTYLFRFYIQGLLSWKTVIEYPLRKNLSRVYSCFVCG